MGDRFHSQIVRTQSVVVVTLAIFLCPAYGIPQDYLARRQAFVQAEDSMRIGAELVGSTLFSIRHTPQSMNPCIAPKYVRTSMKSTKTYQVKEEVQSLGGTLVHTFGMMVLKTSTKFYTDAAEK